MIKLCMNTHSKSYKAFQFILEYFIFDAKMKGKSRLLSFLPWAIFHKPSTL